MALSDISIRKPVFAWMLMFATLVFGGIGFARLGVSQFPDVDIPTVTVQVTREGAAPEIMETEVVDLIEDAVMSVEGVRQVSSSSQQSRASVTVEFELNRDIDAALQDVQTKVAQAQRRLPDDMDPPVISKTNPEDQPIMWVTLSGLRSAPELSDLVRYKFRDEIQTAHPGIAEVSMGGFLERSIRVWVDSKKLEAYQMTVEDVMNAIQREHLEVPAGRLEADQKEFNIRFKGEASNLKDFEDLVVAEKNGSQILLKEVALVEDGLEDMRRVARSQGLPAQGMGIKKMRGANAVDIADAVRKKIEEIQKTLPPDLNLSIVFDSTLYIKESIEEIEFALLLSVVLTAVVCWLFLGSFSSTLNVILAIPTSLLGTFAVMYFCNFTLNMISLLALSLSVGIVVDDSIMVLENIYRHAERGEGRHDASLNGAREITFAALAATLAIIAIFLPVAFMKGLIGRFFFQFGVTISVAVLFSYLEAVTLTPARCSQMLNVAERQSRLQKMMHILFASFERIYARVLPSCLKWRYGVMVFSAFFFFGSLMLIKLLGKEFTPAQDQNRFLVRLQAPIGSSLQVTNEMAKICEDYLMRRPEVQLYFCAVGGFGGGDVDTAMLFITLTPPKERKLTQQEIIEIVRKDFSSIPNLRAIAQDLSRQDPGGRRNFPVELILKGPDWTVLSEASQKIMEALKNSGMMADVDSNYRVGMPELKIIPDRRRAADAHVSMESLGKTIQALVGGVKVGKFETRGRRYDVRVRLLKPQRLRPEDIQGLLVKTQNNQLMRLSDLVKIEEHAVLQNITRQQRSRAITITANMAEGVSQSVALDKALEISRNILPDGYDAELSGGAATFKESFYGLVFAMILGFVVAYMVLASQFNSFLHPLTVLIALPFSITGALFALWLGGYTLNIFSMLGILLLMGLVKKNSIILVDYTNQQREKGLTHEEALLKACPVRLRPILMTTFSTLAGAVPPALALGPGGEIRTPMALSIIGGLLISTLFTLLVVPAIYCIFEDISSLFKRRKKN